MENPKPTNNSNPAPVRKDPKNKRAEFNRASKHQLKLRIDYTLELLMNDMSSQDIVKILTTKYQPLSTRQALRYYYIAFAALQERENINIARKKSWYFARKLRLIRDMDPKAKRSPQGAAVINEILNSLAAMDGIETKITKVRGDRDNPIEVNHNHEHEHTHHLKARIDYSKLPTELLESYVQLHEQSLKYLSNPGSSNIEDAQIIPSE
ncbi:MAG TPA: hypothetical protein PLU07_10745 [Ferruginibacter sp.]|nr:hypothetical protein [Ferruginibacter sp.]HRO18661.1 hypothetical protein [Ferruginibacter sp.]HRO97568.1 hypothetical protein [Ferruginibacter sp.]